MLRTLLWKEWRQLRQLRWVGAGLGALLPIVALAAPRAARHGWVPFVGTADPYSANEILLEALPLALGLGLWPLIALLMTAQAFSGDRAAGTESFLLERPVSRTRVWVARTLASFGSTWLVVTVSFLIWLGIAATAAEPTPGKWSFALEALLRVGSPAVAASLLGGMIAASILSAPLAALLLGVVLVMVPIFIASTLAEWFSLATLRDMPVGLFVPALLLVVYPLASWAATCRGEPAGRGRIFRGTTTIAAGLFVMGLVFFASAPMAVRALAKQLDHGAELSPSPAGPSACFGSSRKESGGWIVDLETGDRIRFLAPPFWHAGWSEDGSRMAVVTMSGPMGSTSPAMRIEFYDAQGRSAGRTLRYDENTGMWRMRWAGDRLLLYEATADLDAEAFKSFRLRVYDPATGASESGDAPEYLRMAGLVGPTTDGRMFAVIRESEDRDDGERGSRYGLYPVDLETGEIGAQPLLEDAGQAWFAEAALSPSGRYWILDRRAGRGELRPILDLETGEEIQIEGLVRQAEWLNDDLLFWVDTVGSERRLVVAEPGSTPKVLKSWSGLAVVLQVSPDRKRLLVTASKALETQAEIVLEQQIVQTWVFDTSDGRWTELTAWPAHPYKGYTYATTWAGPRTLARTGPRVLALESLERPGEFIPVIGSLHD